MSRPLDVIVDEITGQMSTFTLEARKMTNKAAAGRARKLSLSITKALKEYRKESITQIK